MTEPLEHVQRRLESATAIHEIFGAMRAMAAVRLQDAQAALPGTRAYADTVARALAEVLALGPPVPATVARRPALVAFMPEHGFVGPLAERLVDRVFERSDAAVVVVAGDRGADLAEERGLAVHERIPLGAHVRAAPSIARDLAERLERLIAEQRVDGVDILFPRYAGAGGATHAERRLLPLDPGVLPDVAGHPLVNLPVAELADAVVTEWLLGELAHAVVETLASENGARLVAMDAARTSVESKLEGLRRTYRVARQEAITVEISEVVAGVLALERA